ncbi:unnamed product [Ostreococcus tauri]|uniref:Unnamed product n=1 Tax=Ostreococcus tauri TaxID=70448 RepID=A0A090N3D8_OSTTA|nr:unnamed product [Ostreococcus tauri]CEF97943.1 unnamed product [Ostreococcus tauri]|eukprot:XP_022838982.1 unnamed product [Ostreococcus tauri]
MFAALAKQWPFFTGIGVVGCAIVYTTAGLTEEQKKVSTSTMDARDGARAMEDASGDDRAAR